MKHSHRIAIGLFISALMLGSSGCLLAAAGAGAEAAYVGTQEDRTAGDTIDDQRITSFVKTKLLADPQVSGVDINVDTFKGAVTLRGFVDTTQEAERAIELATSVSGVTSVRSTLIQK